MKVKNNTLNKIIILILVQFSNYSINSMEFPESIKKEEVENKWQKKLNSKLFRAVSQRNLPEVIALLDKGAQINFIDPNTNITPLQLAIDKSDYKMITYFVDKGADLTLTGTGKTILFFPIVTNNLNMVQFLVELGFPINLQDIEIAQSYAPQIVDYLKAKIPPAQKEPAVSK